MLGSSTATLIIFNKEVNDIIQIVNLLGKYGLFKRSISKRIENDVK